MSLLPTGNNPYLYRTPPFVPEERPQQPNFPGSVIGDIMGKSAKPTGIIDFGKGAGGWAGSAGSIASGALGAGLGLRDMLKSRSTLGDFFGGAKTGAGIGSMIAPGIGTAIGAGLGALGGGIRSLFRIGKPSQNELAGRDFRESSIRDITRGASPEQLAGAQQAVSSGAWKNVQDPLTLIVMRDHLIRSGVDPTRADQTAQQYMRNMWGATKGGVDAVRGAIPNPSVRF